MRKKTFFIYSILFVLIFIMVPKISYSKKKAAKPKIYRSEAEADNVTTDTPTKKYKGKVGIIKRDTLLFDGYYLYPNPHWVDVPVSYSDTLEKDFLVLVFEGKDDRDTSYVSVYTDPPQAHGRVKKKDISFDIKDFKNSTVWFMFNSIPAYEEINGKKTKNADGFGTIHERKDGWLRVWVVGTGEYWIKESDMNYDYNSVEHEAYDLIF